jgi:hypothetical protein
MEVEIAVLKQQVSAIKHEVLGNGQPGRLDKTDAKIDRTDAKIDSMERRMDKRIGTMEEKMTKIIIAVSLIAQAGGQAVPFVLELLKGL